MAGSEVAGQLRAFRAANTHGSLYRGVVPVAPVPGSSVSWAMPWLIGGWIIGGGLRLITEGILPAVFFGFFWGLMAVALGAVFRVGRRLVRGRQSAAAWSELSTGSVVICGLVLSVGMLAILGAVGVLSSLTPSNAVGLSLLIVLLTPAVLGFLLRWRQDRDTVAPPTGLVPPSAHDIAEAQAHALPFGLWLGQSTGALTALGHGAGLAPGQHVVLGLEEAAQNVVVFGGIGAGKTTRVVQPLLVQLLDQEAGGVIFDIKGDFQPAVATLAEAAGRDVTVMGPGQRRLNLLAGLTPEVAASFLKSVFQLGGTRQEAFWVDTATELCRNALGVLAVVPEHYTLAGLFTYLFDEHARDTLNQEVEKIVPTLEAPAARALVAYQQYPTRIFEPFDAKVKAGVRATVAQVLAPLQHPDLVEAFCTTEPEPVELSACLDGAVVLVDLPLAVWGLGGKVASVLIKLRFFNLMQRRAVEPSWDQTRPVFFLCDEFQEIISANPDGLSDLNFWDKARSTKTVGIIAVQSVSSLYAALGNRDLADAIVQNFRQVLCFRTEDAPTLTRVQTLLGHIDAAHLSYGYSTGTSTAPGHLVPSASETWSETLTSRRQPVLDAQMVRTLGPDEAIALLSIGGYSMDDVLALHAVFV